MASKNDRHNMAKQIEKLLCNKIQERQEESPELLEKILRASKRLEEGLYEKYSDRLDIYFDMSTLGERLLGLAKDTIILKDAKQRVLKTDDEIIAVEALLTLKK